MRNQENPLENAHVFEIQLQGIRCTGCASRITSSFKGSFSIVDAKVNILAEKLQITIKDPAQISKVIEVIKSMDFQVLSDPREIKFEGNNAEKREVFFTFEEVIDIQKKLDNLIAQKPGVLVTELTKTYSSNHLLLYRVVYNPLVVKARWIYDELYGLKLKALKVVNPHLENFRSKSDMKKGTDVQDLILAISILCFFILFALILPNFDFFFEAIVYPQSLNVFSLYTILMFVVTVLVMLKFGVRTFRSSFKNFFQAKTLNMETLITMGSLSSFLMSLFLIIGYSIQNTSKYHLESSMNHDNPESERRSQIIMIVEMLETASLILAIITIGKFLEDKAKMHILKMTDEIFPENTLLANTHLEYIEPKNRNFMIESKKSYELSLIDKYDLIEVKGPSKLLIDGVILHIESDHNLKFIDSACFGCDDVVHAQKGDRIKSGAEILEGKAIIQVENTFENSLLTQMSKQLNLVQNNIEANENGISVIFTKLAAIFVKFIILLSIVTLLVWLIIVGKDEGNVEQFCKWCFPFERAISVLVASCPCALGLAIPSVIVIALNLAMKNSLLIKKNTFFEKINKVNCVVFDKTGTLFTKVEKISDFKRVGAFEFSEEEIWQMISLIEKGSNHPLGQVLYKEAIKRIRTTVFNVNYFPLDKPKQTKNGITANLKSKNRNSDVPLTCFIGNRNINANLSIEDHIQKEISIHESLGQTTLLFSISNKLALVIYLDNYSNLRPESNAVIHYLQNHLQKEVYILSGDSYQTVLRIGEFFDIPHQRLFGNVDAHSKRALLQKLKEKEGKGVMMIGDGLNDVLSLQEAAIGVSINSKSELNIMASDIVALNENLWKIVLLFNISRNARIFIWINLIWAFAYNICVIPIAAGVFNDFGVIIQPFFSSLAMCLSSLFVVLFSNILRFIPFDPSKKLKNQSPKREELKELTSILITERRKEIEKKPSLEIEVIESLRVGEIDLNHQKKEIPRMELGEMIRSDEMISSNTILRNESQKEASIQIS